MRKLFLILKELFLLLRENRLYFLAPIFLALALISFLVYYIGPTIIVSFIYAGV